MCILPNMRVNTCTDMMFVQVPLRQGSGSRQGYYKDSFTHGVFKRETVYATKVKLQHCPFLLYLL